MIIDNIKILNKQGLHARPASVFVQTAKKFQSKITTYNVTKKNGPVDAKSILGVLSLGVMPGDTITLNFEGPDAELAAKAMCELIKSNFGETE
jgi:phosphocarrier protein HPr